MNSNLTEKAKQFFAADLYATEVTGIEIIYVEENYARCELSIDKRHRNAVGAIMGGVIFTLADFCFAVAVNTVEVSAVTLSSNINFMNSSRGNKLIAEAKCVKSGRKNCFCNISISDELGTAVAEVTTVGSRIG